MHGLFRVFVCRSRVRFVSNVFSCSPLYLALVAADTNECIVFGGWSAHIFRPEILCEAMPNIDWVCDGVQQSIWASRKHPVLFSVRPCIFIAPFLSEHSSLFTWFVILFSGGAFVCVVYTQILWGVQNPTSALTNSTTIHRAAAHKLRLACFRAGRLLCIASLLLLLKQWHCLATFAACGWRWWRYVWVELSVPFRARIVPLIVCVCIRLPAAGKWKMLHVCRVYIWPWQSHAMASHAVCWALLDELISTLLSVASETETHSQRQRRSKNNCYRQMVYLSINSLRTEFSKCLILCHPQPNSSMKMQKHTNETPNWFVRFVPKVQRCMQIGWCYNSNPAIKIYGLNSNFTRIWIFMRFSLKYNGVLCVHLNIQMFLLLSFGSIRFGGCHLISQLLGCFFACLILE